MRKKIICEFFRFFFEIVGEFFNKKMKKYAERPRLKELERFRVFLGTLGAYLINFKILDFLP